MWGNSSGIEGGTPTLTYSDVQGMSPSGTLISQDPFFMPVTNPTGTWDTVTYDGTTLQTTLTVTGNPWAGVDLVGVFVQPKAASTRWFPILDNTANAITVSGNLAGWVAGGDTVTFNLYDLHLQSGSPCVDTGDPFLTFSVDVEGHTRADGTDLDTIPQPDMGAYEWQP